MAKYFIVSADPIKYHPKNSQAVKDLSITKHAISLHTIKKTVGGFTTEEIFVGEDYGFYNALAKILGSSVSDYANCGLSIDFDNRGNVEDFSLIKRYESILSIAEFFGISPNSDIKK